MIVLMEQNIQKEFKIDVENLMEKVDNASAVIFMFKEEILP